MQAIAKTHIQRIFHERKSAAEYIIPDPQHWNDGTSYPAVPLSCSSLQNTLKSVAKFIVPDWGIKFTSAYTVKKGSRVSRLQPGWH
jgi:hypothetical protein